MSPATPYHSPRRCSARGFTLVEVLTVVGIIALLVALTTPALVDVLRATRLNSAGDSLLSRISLAQQSAISLSSEVELRFYKYVDGNSDRPSTPSFYSYQIVHDQGTGRPLRPLSEPYYLESGIIISDQPEVSPLVTDVMQQMPYAPARFLFNPSVTGAEAGDVEYAALRFYPDGSCRLLQVGAGGAGGAPGPAAFVVPPLTLSFLTLVETRFAEAATPTNFYCIQIDSYTGKTRVYRP